MKQSKKYPSDATVTKEYCQITANAARETAMDYKCFN